MARCSEYTLAFKSAMELDFAKEIEEGSIKISHYPFGMPVPADPDLGEHLVVNGGNGDAMIPFVNLPLRKYNLLVGKYPDGTDLIYDDVEFCVARTGCWMNGDVNTYEKIEDMDKDNTTLTIICKTVDVYFAEEIKRKQYEVLSPGVYRLPEYEGFPVYLVEVSKMENAGPLLRMMFF